MSRAKKIRREIKKALALSGDMGYTTHTEETIEAHTTYHYSKNGPVLRYRLTYRRVGIKSMERFARKHGIKPSQIKGLFL